MLYKAFCSSPNSTHPCCFKAVFFSGFVPCSGACSLQIFLTASFTTFVEGNEILKCMLSTWYFLRLLTQSNKSQNQDILQLQLFQCQILTYRPQPLCCRTIQKKKGFTEGKNSFPLSSHSHMDEMFLLKLSKKSTFEPSPRAAFEHF